MKKTLLLLWLISSFSNAQIINIPDANFKAKLVSANLTNGIAQDDSETNMILDVNTDGEIQLSEALNVAIINVPNSAISDLSGIEFFTNLLGLNCSNNQLTTLSTQSLCNLNYINCSHNQLATFNYCTAQFYEAGFNLSYNNFIELDLSGFNHPMGSTGTLDVSNNPNLVYLNIKNGSDFNSCDPTYYPNNPDCLSELNMDNSLSLQFVCVDENSEEFGLVLYKMNQNGILNQVQVTTDCSLYATLSSGEFEKGISLVILPNPTKDVVTINAASSIQSVQLYDVHGRVLTAQITNSAQSVVDVSNYTNGIYFVKVTTEKGSTVEKIIKE